MASSSERPRKKARRNEDAETSNKRNDASMKHAALTLGQDLIVIQSYIERDQALRAIITCKICFKPLYEPFTTQCGHTYCYSCLCRWFSNRGRSRKTCPDCRTVITEAPAPAYALREITREIFQRPELLSDDDLGGHEQLQREEAAVVERDKNNLDPNTGGLFGGVFQSKANRTSRKPLIDVEDGVMRCPECAWELEDEYTYCNNCGYELEDDEDSIVNGHSDDDDMSDSIVTDDELDADIFPEDQDFSPPRGNFMLNESGSEISQSGASASVGGLFRHSRDHPYIPIGSSSVRYADSDSEGDSFVSNSETNEDYSNRENCAAEDDGTSSLNDFLVENDIEGDEADEEEDVSQTSDSTTKETHIHTRLGRPRYTILDSDDEEPVEQNHSDESAEIETQPNSSSSQSVSNDSRTSTICSKSSGESELASD